MMNRATFLVSFGVLAFGSSACGDSEPAMSNAGQTTFGEDDVIEAVSTFQDSGFTRVTNMPATTQHAASPRVTVWVANEVLSAYLAIDPNDANATAEAFPVGTIIIKQGRDAAGEPDGQATVMAKFDAGFNPEAADWWWGRFDPTGALAESGVVGYCIACHEGNSLQKTDYLAGTPLDNRLP